MALFGPKTEKKPFQPQNLILVAILALIGVQAIGLVFGNAFGFDVRLGVVFLLLATGVSVFLAYGIAYNRWVGVMSDQRDVIAFVIYTAAIVALWIFAPKIAPQVFSVAAQSLQTMILP